jgi:hypothetical protein
MAELKFKEGDKVFITGRECKAVYELIGTIKEAIEQKNSSNFYMIDVLKDGVLLTVGLFENEFRKVD